jgi:hypothetical protein
MGLKHGEPVLALMLASSTVAGPGRCITYEEQSLGRLHTVCSDGTRSVGTWNRTLGRWDTVIRPPAGSGGTHGGEGWRASLGGLAF